MKAQFHIRSGEHQATYNIGNPTTDILDNLIVSKTAEFLALINEPDEDPLNIPPDWQLPVMRSGRIRK